MIRELLIIDFIKPFLDIKEVKNGDEIYEFFKSICGKNDFNSLYILNFLYKFICSDEVAKRKSSAREFEDLFSVLFGGIVTDTQNRKNLQYEVSEFFANVKDKIAGNKREKADIIFPNGYALSLKTLITENKEINMGSFEKKVLFDGLGLESFLTERKNNSGIGLGSILQFTKLLEVLKTAKKSEIFYERFRQMAKFIYGDDLLVAIKENDKLTLNFFSGSEIYEIFSSFCQNADLTKIVNRYEGNSLRIDRDTLLKFCKRVVVLKFDRLQNSVLELINEFDITLHKNYAKYFNGDKNVKNETLQILKDLFENFDKRLKNG
ncbi:hypothetical protein V2I21_03585 [Campylobacter sp. CLAX-22107-21]|uniref:hypothetical protein n=1 Tax=Campylobacter devanensis TaxID=3161138 RepID=UPI002E9B56E8|nr:hypothetical protein [Campylobacter sp. CLAX-22107-21]